MGFIVISVAKPYIGMNKVLYVEHGLGKTWENNNLNIWTNSCVDLII